MEAKEILDYLGIEAADLDAFKAAHGSKYLTEQQIHADKKLLGKFTGKTLGGIKGDILNGYRELEVPFTQSEFDEMPLVDVVKTLNQRREEKFTGIETELKGQIGKTGEEAIKPYTEKISKYEQSLADEKKAKKDIADQFETYKAEAAGKIKQTRIDYFKKDLVTSLDYDPLQIKDELKREGWNSHIDKNFKFDFDENDNPIILDKAGSKIKNPKKADEWLAPKEVLTMEADKLGLIKKNPQGGQPAFRGTPPPANIPGTPPPQNTPPPASRGNRLAPGMEQYRTT